MKRCRPWLIALLVLPLAPLLRAGGPRAGTPPSPPPAAAPDAAQVRAAVGRSLGFLEKEGLAWMRDRKCIACHHGPFLLWTHNEARRRGFPVDEKKLAAWTGEALALFLANRKDYEAKKNGCVEATNLLLAHAAAAPADGKAVDDLQTVRAVLLGAQKAEGFWKYEGQGLKWPEDEANEATTLWALVALGPAGDPARAKALAWLAGRPAGPGAEAAAARLAVAAQGGDPARTEARVKDLLGLQNPDGGWSWARGRPSEPIATGQALYALAGAGRGATDPAVRRAWQYLLPGQRPDGSWLSPTRKPAAKDESIAAYWGSAWATIGLLRTLPDEPR